MQINGRLQLDIKVDSKDYKLSGCLSMKENINTDIDQEAENIANRIMLRVRQKSSTKSANQSIVKQETKSATKCSQTEHLKSQEQSNSRQETLKNDFKSPYISEYRSSCKITDYPPDICELTTPQKNKRRLTKSQTSIKKEQINSKKNIQLAESQYFIENSQNTKDGKHIIQLIDNVHNLVKRNSQILNKVHISSPLKSAINKQSHNFATLQTQSSNKKKEDIVTQLLGSLRNAKKMKDDYQKRFF